jgi:hypothetical protein
MAIRTDSLTDRRMAGIKPFDAVQIDNQQEDRFASCVDGAHGSRDFFGFLLAVGCKSCVRPVCAVLMTAGPDVIRRSGPNQNLALDGA